MCVWRQACFVGSFVFTVWALKLLTFMDRFDVCLKSYFKCCFVFTLWAWELLTFMNWFYVSLKVCFLSCFVFTLWAWELFTFMDWFYVSIKMSFCSCFVFTLWALELLAFMDRFYMCLEIVFHYKCVVTNCTLKCLTSIKWHYHTIIISQMIITLPKWKVQINVSWSLRRFSYSCWHSSVISCMLVGCFLSCRGWQIKLSAQVCVVLCCRGGGYKMFPHSTATLRNEILGKQHWEDKWPINNSVGLLPSSVPCTGLHPAQWHESGSPLLCSNGLGQGLWSSWKLLDTS